MEGMANIVFQSCRKISDRDSNDKSTVALVPAITNICLITGFLVNCLIHKLAVTLFGNVI